MDWRPVISRWSYLSQSFETRPDRTVRSEKPRIVYFCGSFSFKNRSMCKKQGPVQTAVEPHGFENHDQTTSHGSLLPFESELKKKKKKKNTHTHTHTHIIYKLIEVDLHYCSFKHAVRRWDLRSHHSFFSFFFSISLSLVLSLSQYSSFSLLSCYFCIFAFSVVLSSLVISCFCLLIYST